MLVIDLSAITPKPGPVRNVRLCPGTLAATLGAAGAANTAVWWNLADRKLIGTSAIFPPACAEEERPPAFLDPVFIPPDLLRCAVHGFEYGSGSVVFDSVVVVASGIANDWCIYDDAEKKPRATLLVLAGDYWEMGLEALSVSPDGNVLVAVGGNGYASRWDLRQVRPGTQPAQEMEATPLLLGREDSTEDWPHGEIVALALAPDGAILATGTDDGGVQLLDLATGSQVAVLLPPAAKEEQKDACIRKLAYSLDGTLLAARSARWVTILDPVGQAAPVRLPVDTVTDVVFHPDGTRLLTGGSDARVRVWDTIKWKEVGQYDWEIGAIHSVAVSPDGLTAAVGGESGLVVVWDLAD